MKILGKWQKINRFIYRWISPRNQIKGVEIYLEVPYRNFISLSADKDDLFVSTAMFKFITVLNIFFPSRNDGEKTEWHNQKDADLVWLKNIMLDMKEDLELLITASHGLWEYSRTDYELYLENMKDLIAFHGMPSSYEYFIQMCEVDETKWVETTKLKNVIDDLIRVLKKTKPEDKWFYSKEFTLREFLDLSLALQIALDQGHQRSRLIHVDVGY